ncbi:MAG TPA: TIGR01777 family oxidoreductase [Acidimicrobiia bacterium]|nr:TIGR01777 family oxidoreductase [Acidimicrobiia bacterium]
MDVAISGASGLLGSALAASLQADGHQVLRFKRGGITKDDEIGWDPDAGRIDAPALEGIDAVVHLAGEGIGEKRWSDVQKKRILTSRTTGTAILAAAVASRERKPSVLVSASAVGYYGDRGDEILTEASAPGEGFLADVCKAWEAETRPAADAGVRTVNVRTGIVLAKHGGALQRMLLPFRLGVGGRQGSGRQWMSWITLDDEVAALRAAIDDERLRGPVDLTAPNPVTNADFARALGRVLRRPTVLPTPMFPLKLRYGGELVDSLLLASQRVLPARLEAISFPFRYPVLQPALEAILRGR